MSHNIAPSQVLLDSVLIHTYDASVEYKSRVDIAVSQSLKLPESRKHKLEILVENMGRTNIDWQIKKLHKGNMNTPMRQ